MLGFLWGDELYEGSERWWCDRVYVVLGCGGLCVLGLSKLREGLAHPVRVVFGASPSRLYLFICWSSSLSPSLLILSPQLLDAIHTAKPKQHKKTKLIFIFIHSTAQMHACINICRAKPLTQLF